MKSFLSVLALGTLLSAAVFSHAEDKSHHHHHGLMISDAWSRVTTPGAKVGGGYLTITNKGQHDERLLSIAAPHASRAEVHTMLMQDDVMVMRPLEGHLTIAAGETVHLAPGGLHLMFMQLNQPHVVDEPFEVTLTFARAGDKTVQFEVLSMRDSMERAAGSAGHQDHKAGHDH